jgi:DnaJ family protein C protein 7
MAEPDRMEIDSEEPVKQSPPYVAPPTSPPPQANVPAPAFDTPKPVPKVNGTNGMNGEGPVPPPHKSNPTSPAPPPAPVPTADDAEAFKTAGNKFYKAKEYRKAIEEYTKGLTAPAHPSPSGMLRIAADMFSL